MKWKKVLTSASQEIYELWNNDKKQITLEFHPSTNSARIEHEAEKRVFLIRKEGFRRNKTVLCNEYGVRLGYLINENKESFIQLRNDRYSYTIENNPGSELVIYNESSHEPLVICGLDLGDENIKLNLQREKAVPVNALSGMLLSLGWFMLQPVVNEKILEYA